MRKVAVAQLSSALAAIQRLANSDGLMRAASRQIRLAYQRFLHPDASLEEGADQDSPVCRSHDYFLGKCANVLEQGYLSRIPIA